MWIVVWQGGSTAAEVVPSLGGKCESVTECPGKAARFQEVPAAVESGLGTAVAGQSLVCESVMARPGKALVAMSTRAAHE